MASQKKTPPTKDSPEVLARVTQGLRFVDAAARQLGAELPKNVQRDDLVSYGREGLLAAARSYDVAYGVPFERWASIRVRGAMLDGVRATGGLPRRVYRLLRGMEAANRVADALGEEHAAAPPPDAESADKRLGSYLASMATAMTVGLLRGGHEADEDLTPEEQVGEAELVALVRAGMGRLPEAERHLLERHYFGGATLEEAALELGLSKSWASRLHARAMETLTRELRSKID